MLADHSAQIELFQSFGNDYLETDMILHEFGHSFVNPLSKKYEKEIENLRTKYYDKKLEKSGRQQGYSQWKYVFNEILLRAIVINISRSKFGKEKADKLLEFEKSVG